MRNQLLFLLCSLAATEVFAGGISGSGPPMKRSYCKGTKAQLIIESQGTNESLLLNPMVIARASGMSGSGPPAQRVVIALNSDDFSEIRELIDHGKNLRIQDFKDWIEVTSADFDSENEQINMKLENHIVIQITSEDDGGIGSGGSGSAGLAADQAGISGGGPAGIGSGQPYESFNGGGGGTPTITDIDDGAAGGGGTIGDGGGVSPTITGGGSSAYGGTVIGTGSGGTLAECGISSGGDFISDSHGGSGVSGGGWTKEADGIAVGGGSPE